MKSGIINFKSKIFLIFAISALTVLPLYSSLFLITTTIKNKEEGRSGALDNLLNFKDIPLEPKYRSSWENLVNSSQTYSAAYDWKYKVELENEAKRIKNGNVDEISVDLMQKKPIRIKSKRVDAIYLGLQVMGHNSPSASPLHEIERYEISNFSALEESGFKLYVNQSSISDKKILDIININQEDSFIDESGNEYFNLVNLNNTDNIFFKTNEEVNENDIGQVVKLNFLAKKKINNGEEETLNVFDPYYRRKELNISIQDNKVDSFIQFKLWDWNQYHSNNENLQCYIASNLIKIYAEIALNYINFIDPKSEMYQKKAAPLEGIDNVFNNKGKEYRQDSPGSLLYYAYKYNSFYDLRIFLFDLGKSDNRYIYISYDQNNWVEFIKAEEGNEDKVIVDKIEETSNNYSNREELPFNPWIEFNTQLKDFTQRTWNLLLFANSEMS
ncbi:hypothetical protein [Spiroplasma endosymbiont of Cantharis nigra]|uniref:hypothetical protein n=1 Tax=Spiroplasma endosymbiont of Cantharis nigra TaxID=3066278 RepID=UPI0030CEEAEC